MIELYFVIQFIEIDDDKNLGLFDEMNIRKTKNGSGDGHNTGAERYLITYADLITLLLGLFVILYSSSQVDQEKFKDMSVALSNYFKAKDSKVLLGGDGVISGHKDGVPEPILNPISQRSLSEISSEINESLKKFIEMGNLEIKLDENGLIIQMPEKLLFKSGKAEIQPDANSVLDTLAKILEGTNKKISINGHTDIVPIRTFQFESNWHLSVTRAMNVAYKMIRSGLPEYNLEVKGFGAQRPIADNTNEDGKARNRRVEIILQELTVDSPTNHVYTKKDSITKKN